MQVKDLARSLSVSADTVRFYTRKGFLSPQKNPDNGYKEYRQHDLARLRFILAARDLGFTVKDIQEIFAVSDKKGSPCPLVRELIEKRLRETEQRYQATKKLRDRMHNALRYWRTEPNAQPTGESICHLIENFPKALEGADHE